MYTLRSNWCVFDPNLHVRIVRYCVRCPSHSVLNDLDPQNAPGGYTLSFILYNTATPRATESEAEREVETQVKS